jgi:hypothetical protein
MERWIDCCLGKPKPRHDGRGGHLLPYPLGWQGCRRGPLSCLMSPPMFQSTPPGGGDKTTSTASRVDRRHVPPGGGHVGRGEAGHACASSAPAGSCGASQYGHHQYRVPPSSPRWVGAPTTSSPKHTGHMERCVAWRSDAGRSVAARCDARVMRLSAWAFALNAALEPRPHGPRCEAAAGRATVTPPDY